VNGQVTSVSSSPDHGFSKPAQQSITLLVGLGVEGDAHLGVTVQHLSRVARDPSQPNLRQVHLIHAELHDELNAAGYQLRPGDMGENITTRGVDLLGLPTGTLLRFGDSAVVEVTGLRNPCQQLNNFRPTLMQQLVWRADDGSIVRRGGIMGIVLAGGEICPGDPITVTLPAEPHRVLEPV
jgi:MOSC domain-containing protein YiiM